MNIFSLVTTLITIGLLLPSGTAFAMDLDALIEAAKKGNGTYVESHSSVSTGGQTVKSGESVITGDARASSYTEIHSGSEGGSVQVRIESEENGVQEVREVSEVIPKGEEVRVEARAESISGKATDVVTINGETVESNTTTKKTIVKPLESTEPTMIRFFSERIPSFFKRIISVLMW